jgi:hypothetical protein
MCGTHYERWRRHVKHGREPNWPNKGRACAEDDCDQPAYCKGYCTRHYNNLLHYGYTRSSADLSDWEFVERKNWTVTDTGCWEYAGKRNDRGYGIARERRAHRISYEHHHGPVPAGLFVRHSCDNPPCVNPEHLQVGTHADNMRDMVQRRRHWRHR